MFLQILTHFASFSTKPVKLNVDQKEPPRPNILKIQN